MTAFQILDQAVSAGGVNLTAKAIAGGGKEGKETLEKLCVDGKLQKSGGNSPKYTTHTRRARRLETRSTTGTSSPDRPRRTREGKESCLRFSYSRQKQTELGSSKRSREDEIPRVCH